METIDKRSMVFLALGSAAVSTLLALLFLQLTPPVYLIVMGVVLFLILIYKNIEIGIGLLIASMLFEKPILPGEIEISLTRILSLPVLLAGFGRVLFHARAKFVFQKYKDLTVLLLLGWCFLSLLYAPDLGATVAGLITLVQLVFLYFIFKTVIADETALQRVLNVTVVCSVAIAIFTIAIMVVDHSSVFYASQLSLSQRVAGSSDDPNKFAMGLIFILPFSIYLLLTNSRLYLGTVLLFSFLIFSTFSRGGYAALAMVFSFSLILIARKIKHGLFYSTVLSCILVASFIALNQGNKVLQRIESFQEFDSGSIGTRIELLEVALDMGINNPIRGVGLSNFRANSQFYGNQRHYDREAHNGYLEVFATLGLPGFALLLALIYFSYKDIARFQGTVAADSSGVVEAALLAAFVKIAFAGYLLAAAFLTLLPQKLFWTLLAFSSVLNNLAEQRVSKSQSSTKQVTPKPSTPKLELAA